MSALDRLPEYLKTIRRAAKRRGWTVSDRRQPGASSAEVRAIERASGVTFGPQLSHAFRRNALLSFSYEFEAELPEPFDELQGGALGWDLLGMPRMVDDWRGWIDGALYPGSNDPEAIAITASRLAEHTVPILEVPNGDLIVVHVPSSEVRYAGHEGDSLHGVTLFGDLDAYLDASAQIGFVGSEGWMLETFVEVREEVAHLRPERVAEFRELCGLDAPSGST